MALDKAGLLARSVLKVERVEIPEWGGESVHIREITATERDLYEGRALEKKGLAKYQDLRAGFLVLTLCDDQGRRLFEDSDLAEVGKLPAGVADRLWGHAMRLNRMFKEDVEELAGNSGTAPSAG